MPYTYAICKRRSKIASVTAPDESGTAGFVVEYGYGALGNVALITEEYCGGTAFRYAFSQDAFGCSSSAWVSEKASRRPKNGWRPEAFLRQRWRVDRSKTRSSSELGPALKNGEELDGPLG